MIGSKILLVDDEKELVGAVSSYLEGQGYKVIPAYNGREALEKAANDIPDLVILDIRMPGMDGLEVLRRLKSDSNTSYVDVIMLTAKTESESLLEAQELGSWDYVIKPVRIKELSDTVKHYFEMREDLFK